MLNPYSTFSSVSPAQVHILAVARYVKSSVSARKLSKSSSFSAAVAQLLDWKIVSPASHAAVARVAFWTRKVNLTSCNGSVGLIEIAPT